MRETEFFICDGCDEQKDADFIALNGRNLLCFDCFDKAQKEGESGET